MTAFISHSFENKPEFDNIADALRQAEVPYWNPNEVQPGSSLRDQLRTSVDECSVCIFIATHRAVQSSWCGAELGAFWGAGKPILVYISDSSLKEDDLPPIVHGLVWERRISRIVARAGELVKTASATNLTKTPKSTNVGAMTAEQLEQLILGAFSLAAASAKSSDGASTPEEIGRAAKGAADTVLEGIQATTNAGRSVDESWRKHILWVDDLPDNNIYPRQAFESIGLKITLALSTQEALKILSTQRFGAIISDMGRKEGPREGYVLLDALRAKGDRTPFFIYAGSNKPEHKREAQEHGGQGSTNNARDLFSMVTRALGTTVLD